MKVSSKVKNRCKVVRTDVQLRIYALALDFKERREKNLRLIDIWWSFLQLEHQYN